MDVFSLLPDDILPLFAGGSNTRMASLRELSRRFARVCAVPAFERSGMVIRRGSVVLDLMERYDTSIAAPVLDDIGVGIARDILGKTRINLRVYHRTVKCAEPTLPVRYFNGISIGEDDVGTTRLSAYGAEIEIRSAVCGDKRGRVLRQVDAAHIEWYSIVVDTAMGRRYWTGPRKTVEWFAERVTSTMLAQVCL